MKNNEFCYWLQGFFELRSSLQETDLPVPTWPIILNHINLVKQVEKIPHPYIAWLEGVLMTATSQGYFSTEIETELKNRLNKVFEHEIDPSYAEDPTLLNRLNIRASEGVALNIVANHALLT